MPASCISFSIFLRRVARDFFRLETVECAAEILALAQDRDPGKPGLETVEHQFFIKRAIVVFRHAPLVVVIGDIERILPRPRTAMQAVGMEHGGHLNNYSAAFASPGQSKRAQAGLTGCSAMPPDMIGVPAASASPMRARCSIASPRPVRRRAHDADLGFADPHRPRRPRGRSPQMSPAPRACAPCRDARPARRPPGRHSSPCRSRCRPAGPCRLHAGRRRCTGNRARRAARRARCDALRIRSASTSAAPRSAAASAAR